MFVDADTGQVIWSIPPGGAYLLDVAPHGSQVAVLDLDAGNSAPLRLIRPQDGSIQFTMPVPLKSFGLEGSTSPFYSPDGQFVLGFTDNGIMRINAAKGQWQVLPLEYKPIAPPGDSIFYLSPKVT